MAYKGVDYKSAPGNYVNTDVIIDRIIVRPRGEILTVAVEISAGTKTNIALFESVDGSDWVAIGTPATYGANFGIVTFKGVTAFPSGSLLQLRAAGTITVDRVLVVQDW